MHPGCRAIELFPLLRTMQIITNNLALNLSGGHLTTRCWANPKVGNFGLVSKKQLAPPCSPDWNWVRPGVTPKNSKLQKAPKKLPLVQKSNSFYPCNFDPCPLCPSKTFRVGGGQPPTKPSPVSGGIKIPSAEGVFCERVLWRAGVDPPTMPSCSALG